MATPPIPQEPGISDGVKVLRRKMLYGSPRHAAPRKVVLVNLKHRRFDKDNEWEPLLK